MKDIFINKSSFQLKINEIKYITINVSMELYCILED